MSLLGEGPPLISVPEQKRQGIPPWNFKELTVAEAFRILGIFWGAIQSATMMACRVDVQFFTLRGVDLWRISVWDNHDGETLEDVPWGDPNACEVKWHCEGPTIGEALLTFLKYSLSLGPEEEYHPPTEMVGELDLDRILRSELSAMLFSEISDVIEENERILDEMSDEEFRAVDDHQPHSEEG